MSFDLKQWKDRISEGLQNLKSRVSGFAGQSVYGFASTLALWPLVEAVKTGDLAGPIMALGGIAGGVGANLIANQLQQWKDGDQAAMMKNLSLDLASRQELRDAVDSVLAELKVISSVKCALGDEDRTWFQDSLKEELARLGNLERFKIEIEGDHNIIAGGDVVGSGAILDKQTGGIQVRGDVEHLDIGDKYDAQMVVVAKEGSTVLMNEQPVMLSAVDMKTALGRYLSYLISCNRYLQLQGIRSGGKLVNIELEQIYITLRASRTRTVEAEENWLSEESRLAPGERKHHLAEHGLRQQTETVSVKVEEALAENKRLVVLGDPGSGKTTLLRYLALAYARDIGEGSNGVRERLGIEESGLLPIFISLRKLGAYLKEHHPKDDGAAGYGIILDFLNVCLKNERISVPIRFFDDYLRDNRAVAFLDGLDEVGDAELRRRTARLIDDWSAAYPKMRMVVTSRIVGYTGAARLGEGFATTTVRDFTLKDVEQFLTYWNRLAAIGQMGHSPSAEHYAENQTEQLLSSIKANPRVRELAINPLMLTVIALVHRDRVKLPERRVELYAEAVDVLLGKWDEARGVNETSILEDRPFDTNDRRQLLQAVAFRIQEEGKKEIETADLFEQLEAFFANRTADSSGAKRAADRFLKMIKERTGLLVEAGQGVYRFSHLTFQEYLAALAVLDDDDYANYLLNRTGEAEWREVILLALGKLSMEGPQRTTQMVKRIADLKKEPAPFHNMVLAVEALRDVGNAVERTIAEEIQGRVEQVLSRKRSPLSKILGGLTAKGWVEEKSRLVEALSRVGMGYWSMPHGEPTWVTIPAGEFWMGNLPYERVHVDEFLISKVPITNAQYLLYVQAEGAKAPEHWEDGMPPKNISSHPVVNVNRHDAVSYCEWLSRVSGKTIRLPTEAEWEKAARGDQDKREYPWGDTFDSSKCNTSELGIRTTTSVGIFTSGASPYGVLDMSGNVWEWTQSIKNSKELVLRGGAFDDDSTSARSAFRFWGYPNLRLRNIGFRVVASPFRL